MQKLLMVIGAVAAGAFWILGPAKRSRSGRSAAHTQPSPSPNQPARPEQPARRAATDVAGAARQQFGRVEDHFAGSWPVPAQAGLVARLFTGAVALACAGLLTALATLVPGPAMPLTPLAGGILSRAAGGAGGAALGGGAGGVAVAAAILNPSLLGGLAPTAPPDAAAAGKPDVTPPTLRGALPVGKGMWLYLPEQVEGGNAEAIAARAVAVGLTHVYVRTGSSRKGFYAQEFLDRLLPVAHAHGLRVYGWDFPYFESWSDDVFRALDAILYTTPDGHRIDGFSADIETRSEGTNISAHHAHEYGNALRNYVGPDYPLIATIPRPSKALIAGGYPFAEIVAAFDAIAPMVYWQNREPGGDVAGAIEFLAAFGKPIIPVGQAYDGGPEGGPQGVPSRDQILRFMRVAEERGAIGVSFWSWQHADQEAWDAIADAAEFRLVAGSPDELTPGMVRAYQGLLSSLGFPAPMTGAWDKATGAAVASYQQAARLPVTATVDTRTRTALLTPFNAPVQPQG